MQCRVPSRGCRLTPDGLRVFYLEAARCVSFFSFFLQLLVPCRIGSFSHNSRRTFLYLAPRLSRGYGLAGGPGSISILLDSWPCNASKTTRSIHPATSAPVAFIISCVFCKPHKAHTYPPHTYVMKNKSLRALVTPIAAVVFPGYKGRQSP